MTSVLMVAMVCGALAYAVQRAEALAARWLALQEDAAKRAATMPEKVRIPADLIALADEHSEPWAREQFRAVLRDAYEELGDWGAVRQKVMP